MRIGMLAPIAHPFPPSGYGPWEAVSHDLAEGLVELGQDVVVFAPPGSSTSAELHPTVPMSLEEATAAGVDHDPRVWETLHIGRAAAEAARLRLDVLHSHLHVHALGYGPLLPMPLVTTLHGAAWDPAHRIALTAHRDQAFVSLSAAEREMAPDLNYVATVGNGVVVADYPWSENPDSHLVFVGRMAPEKAPDLAIDVARRTQRPLLLAGMVEEKHRDYFDEKIRPALGTDVVYLGALSRRAVAEQLAGATALLMPLRWDEPFGMVVIESMLAGTPVVAWRRGAMPDLVEPGVTGFLVDGVAEAVTAVEQVGELDRRRCRAAAEERFDHLTMARGYLGAYERAVSQTRAEINSARPTVPIPILLSDTP
jgi:glycosyltransferase involved in cell wall biosynthesis